MRSPTRAGSARRRSLRQEWIGRTVSPSTTAHFTSPRAPGFRGSTGSRTASTTRVSRWSSTATCRTISRMAGGTSASARTTSSTSTSERPVTSASRRRSMRRSGGSTSTAAAPKSTPAECATRSASTGIRSRKQFYFTEHGRDWLSEDLPEDELNRVTAIGQHFGFPYCHHGNFTDREMGWGRSCDDYEKPVALLGPHSAALGMRFYTGTMFPSGVQECDLHGPPRLVEPDQEDWRRRDRGETQQRRHGQVPGAVPDRLPREQPVQRPPGRCGDHEGRFAAGLRRLCRRGLPGHLRSAAWPHAECRCNRGRATALGLFWNCWSSPCAALSLRRH